MPTRPVPPPVSFKRRMLAMAVPVLATQLLAAAVPDRPALAEPAHGGRQHPAAHLPPALPLPAPRLTAQPPPAPRPTGPLDTPAALIAHPETSLIEAVAHAGQRLVAVGLNGLILLSDDQGLSWRQVQPPVQATLTAVTFSDEQTGWAVGHYGVVLRTEDAGEDWSLVLDGPRAAQVTLESALVDNQSDSARDREIDTARRLASTEPSRPFLLVESDGSDTLRAIGDDRMALETQDGGKHWHPWSDAIDDPDGLPLLGEAMRDGVMLVDGAKGILLAGRPEDGLARLASPTEASLFGALDAGRFGFVIYGQQGNAFVGTLAQPASATRAQAWRQVDVPTQNAFTAGLLRRDGVAMLGDSAGMTWTLTGKPDNPHLETAAPRAPFPILAMIEASDGGLILAGAGGLVRIEPPAPPAPPPIVASPVPAPPAVIAPAPIQAAPAGGKADQPAPGQAAPGQAATKQAPSGKSASPAATRAAPR